MRFYHGYRDLKHDSDRLRTRTNEDDPHPHPENCFLHKVLNGSFGSTNPIASEAHLGTYQSLCMFQCGHPQNESNVLRLFSKPL